MYRISRLLYRIYHLICYPLAAMISLVFIGIGALSHRMTGEISQPSLVMSRIPFFLGELARSFYYKGMLDSVGTNVTFKFGSFCQYRNARIGSRVLIGYFNTLGQVSIGDNVLIGGNVNILSGLNQHSFEDPSRLIWDTPGEGRKTIQIGSDVWIGSNAVIGADIGSRCTIAAGSVVVKQIDSHTLAGGNPARFIRSI